ncbi:MAG TPA: lipocalin family protein [Salegentibacter sp.]|nr:lipocalin family protein [Salegentibacter sp.]
MKKLFALLAVFMMFTACDSDDDANEGDDPILGTWFLVDWNIPTVEGPTECNMESNIVFNADNTADTEFYEEVEGNCVSDVQSGEWEAHGNNQYTFEVPNIGEQRGTVTFEGNNRFTFTLTGISMTFEK